jgi:uncharacterized lipoprotein YddW (UPF0748 family)
VRSWGLLLLLGALPLPAPGANYGPAIVLPPKPMREYRAAWVATVGNIDWPSRADLSTAEQKAELLAILDRAVQLKLNTVIFQVRPGCDAMYASSIEPWSEYLTGTMGKAPEPFYDPLAFAISEAHQRGLELHAWFNPYRARILGTKSPTAANHVSKTHPQIVRHYGKYLWLDPGEKETQDYSLSVIMDVVKRYDVDGVHFDDYFYPYKENDASGKELDFPDDASWQRCGAAGKMSRDDWRRENVNVFIQRAYKSIKATKPWVKFGISPFGIWRPGNPPQIQGYDSYAKLYADSRKWLANGWMDYFAPQLYWSINAPEQSYPVLLKWWAQQNPQNRHLVPGMDSTKTRRQWKPDEIVNQIRLTRKQAGTSGHIHWNMRSLLRNPAFDAALERDVYALPALVPPSTWLGNAHLKRPRLTASYGSPLTFRWSASEGEKPALWVVQTRSHGEWTTQIVSGAKAALSCKGTPPDVVAVTGVDRNGNLGAPASLQLQR